MHETGQQALCVRDADREPDGYYSEDKGWPYWVCDCGHGDSQPFAFAEGQILLCSHCVDAAANLYWRQIAGEFLTWKNPPRTKTSARKAIRAETRQRIFERDAYRCRYCGGYINLVLDHLIPYIKTQDNSEENLVTACRVCNAKKQDRTPEEANMVLLPIPAAGAVNDRSCGA